MGASLRGDAESCLSFPEDKKSSSRLDAKSEQREEEKKTTTTGKFHIGWTQVSQRPGNTLRNEQRKLQDYLTIKGCSRPAISCTASGRLFKSAIVT